MKTTALDPRLKHMKVVDNKIRRELEDEMGQNILYQQVTGVDTEMKDSKEKKRKLCLDFDESDYEESDAEDWQVVRREIENYKAGRLLDKDSDPLDWCRKDKYPNLVRLVR